MNSAAWAAGAAEEAGGGAAHSYCRQLFAARCVLCSIWLNQVMNNN